MWPLLLGLYPRDFRRRYGDELLHLVEAAIRDGVGSSRSHGLAFWATALIDLAVNGLGERAREAFHMTRHTFIRWTGLASAVGGVIFLTGMLTPLRGPLRAGVPAGVALMALGAWGLYTALHGRDRTLERLGLALAGTGLALGLIGMAGSALSILDPNPLAPIINTGEHIGLPLVGAGMVVWGVISIRTGAFGRWSFAPIPVGLCGLAGVAVVNPAVFRALESGFLPLVFAAGWIVLGVALASTPAGRSPVAARS